MRDVLPAARSWVMSSRLLALLVAGELREAGELLDLVDSVSEQPDPEARGFLCLARGRLALLQGLPVTAARWLRESAALLDELNTVGRQAWAFSLLAEALAYTGDATGASDAARDAIVTEQTASPLYDGDAARARIWAQVASGSLTHAREEALRVAAANARSAPVYELFALHDALRLGAIKPTVDRIVELGDQMDGRLGAAYASHARARRLGDGAALMTAATTFADIGCSLFAAESAAEAAAAHHRAGRRGDLAEARVQARVLADRCEGATTPALQIPGESVALTARELEIARLAARGLTSPDIARQLVCSVRTVDNHLARVYTKLGISRRDGLATRIPPGPDVASS
jgi:DNA-binding CsgD family transcriptional regulator